MTTKGDTPLESPTSDIRSRLNIMREKRTCNLRYLVKKENYPELIYVEIEETASSQTNERLRTLIDRK